MIFHRSLVREFGALAAAVGLVLLAIILTTLLIRLLGKAADGAAVAEGVLALLGFSALNYLPVILSLTAFVAVLLTLGRSYADSEMVVWFSSGLSLTAWLKPVLYFSLPLALLVAGLSFGLAPWAQRQAAEYQHQLESRDEVAGVAPGVFRESRRADRVFFVENLSPEQNVISNVFVQSMQSGKLGVMVAQRGRQHVDATGDKFLVLENGRRYEGTPGSADYRIIDFLTYTMRIEQQEATRTMLPVKSMPTRMLWQNPTPANLAELHWRIGLPISMVLLTLLAIPLSFVNPRSGRSLNLLAAILIYMIYSNLLSIFQAWVAQEKISSLVGLWPVHGVMALVVFALFYRRIGSNGVVQFLRRQRAAG